MIMADAAGTLPRRRPALSSARIARNFGAKFTLAEGAHAMTTRSILQYVVPLLALALAPLPASAGTVRIYITNSAGDSIDVIDPVTNKVVQEIKDYVGAHGIEFSPDGSRVYVSNEETSTLDVLDRKTGKLIKKVALSDHPNNISVTKNGDRIVVAIARGKGGLDIVDAATLTLKKTIPTNGGRLHNVYVTPDNKYVVGGSIPSKTFYAFDLDKEQLAWAMPMDLGVRCMAIETNPDGSTKRVFTQLSALNGFSVVDFAEQKEAARIRCRAAAGIRLRRLSRQRAVARHRHLAGQQDAVGHQHPQQRGLRIFARRPEADRQGRPAEREDRRPRGAALGGGGLGDVHAGRQGALRVEFRHALGVGGRYRGDEGHQGDPGRRSAEAQQYAGDPGRAAATRQSRAPSKQAAAQ